MGSEVTWVSLALAIAIAAPPVFLAAAPPPAGPLGTVTTLGPAVPSTTASTATGPVVFGGPAPEVHVVRPADGSVFTDPVDDIDGLTPGFQTDLQVDANVVNSVLLLAVNDLFQVGANYDGSPVVPAYAITAAVTASQFLASAPVANASNLNVSPNNASARGTVTLPPGPVQVTAILATPAMEVIDVEIVAMELVSAGPLPVVCEDVRGNNRRVFHAGDCHGLINVNGGRNGVTIGGNHTGPIFVNGTRNRVMVNGTQGLGGGMGGGVIITGNGNTVTLKNGHHGDKAIYGNNNTIVVRGDQVGNKTIHGNDNRIIVTGNQTGGRIFINGTGNNIDIGGRHEGPIRVNGNGNEIGIRGSHTGAITIDGARNGVNVGGNSQGGVTITGQGNDVNVRGNQNGNVTIGGNRNRVRVDGLRTGNTTVTGNNNTVALGGTTGTLISFTTNPNGVCIWKGWTAAELPAGCTKVNAIQVIDTSHPRGGATSPYVDPRPNDDTDPGYNTDAELQGRFLGEDINDTADGYAYKFIDYPNRTAEGAWWMAEVCVVCVRGTMSDRTPDEIIHCQTYGFVILDGVATAIPPVSTGGPSRDFEDALRRDFPTYRYTAR